MGEQTENNMVKKDESQKKVVKSKISKDQKIVKEKISKGQKEIQDLGVEELSKANFSLLLNTDGLDKKSFFKSDKKPFTN